MNSSHSSVFVSPFIKLLVIYPISIFLLLFKQTCLKKVLIRSFVELGRIKIEASICAFYHKVPTHISFFLPKQILSSLWLSFSQDSPFLLRLFPQLCLCSIKFQLNCLIIHLLPRFFSGAVFHHVPLWVSTRSCSK